jgi:L-fucose isomerase-like protein
MAFSIMNDGGLVATCEADPTAMVIHYLMRWIANKPVAFYDPTVNIGEGKLILAHCTSPTRMRGFSEQPFRYIATTHHESNTSVAPKVLYEPGIVTTTVKLCLLWWCCFLEFV